MDDGRQTMDWMLYGQRVYVYDFFACMTVELGLSIYSSICMLFLSFFAHSAIPKNCIHLKLNPFKSYFLSPFVMQASILGDIRALIHSLTCTHEHTRTRIYLHIYIYADVLYGIPIKKVIYWDAHLPISNNWKMKDAKLMDFTMQSLEQKVFRYIQWLCPAEILI